MNILAVERSQQRTSPKATALANIRKADDSDLNDPPEGAHDDLMHKEDGPKFTMTTGAGMPSGSSIKDSGLELIKKTIQAKK